MFLQLIKLIGEVSKVKSSPKAAQHQVGHISEGPGFYSRFYQYLPGKFPVSALKFCQKLDNEIYISSNRKNTKKAKYDYLMNDKGT